MADSADRRPSPTDPPAKTARLRLRARARRRFRLGEILRRTLRDNHDVVSDMRAATPTSEQYSTFRAYLDERHADGGMADMTVLDYAMMIEDSHVNTKLVEYRLEGANLR